MANLIIVDAPKKLNYFIGNMLLFLSKDIIDKCIKCRKEQKSFKEIDLSYTNMRFAATVKELEKASLDKYKVLVDGQYWVKTKEGKMYPKLSPTLKDLIDNSILYRNQEIKDNDYCLMVKYKETWYKEMREKILNL